MSSKRLQPHTQLIDQVILSEDLVYHNIFVLYLLRPINKNWFSVLAKSLHLSSISYINL